MFDKFLKIFKKASKDEKKDSKDTAKERLHLVLMQDRANVSADFMELMKQEIIEVIKKYIDVDENSIDVKLTNKVNSDGTTGVPMLYANIPIVSVKDDTKQINIERNNQDTNKEEKKEEPKKVNKEEKKEDTKNEDMPSSDEVKEVENPKEEEAKEEVNNDEKDEEKLEKKEDLDKTEVE